MVCPDQHGRSTSGLRGFRAAQRYCMQGRGKSPQRLTTHSEQARGRKSQTGRCLKYWQDLSEGTQDLETAEISVAKKIWQQEEESVEEGPCPLQQVSSSAIRNKMTGAGGEWPGSSWLLSFMSVLDQAASWGGLLHHHLRGSCWAVPSSASSWHPRAGRELEGHVI